MTRAIDPSQFNLRLLPPEFYANPFPTYARLQREAPVLRCPDGSIFLTRHADLLAFYRDTRRFSSDKRVQFAPLFRPGSPLFEHHTTSLVFNDPPLPTRVRRAIGDALSARVVGALEVSADANVLAAGQQAVQQFLVYLPNLVEQRCSVLVGDDIVARLLRASFAGNSGLTSSDAAVAGALSLNELLHQCIFLLNAGHETTTNLIGNGIVLLSERPQEVAQFQSDPARMDAVVEEVLRMESPNQFGNRTATADLTIDGVEIGTGTIITLCIGAANRDPAVFVGPDEFQSGRTPNPHLAFGSGIHTCARLAVARLEGRIGLLRLFQRFPGLKVVSARRAARARFRGYESLEVVLR